MNDFRIGDVWMLPAIGPHRIDGVVPDGRLAMTSLLSMGGTMLESHDGLARALCEGATWERPALDAKGRPLAVRAGAPVEPILPEDAEGLRRRKTEETRLFYIRTFDRTVCKRGLKALRKFIEIVAPKAQKAGYDWVPSAAALAKWIATRGAPGDRRSAQMKDLRGKGERRHFGDVGAEISKRAVDWYYAGPKREQKDAYAWMNRFARRVNGIGRLRYGVAWKDVRVPKAEAFRTRIQRARCRETVAAKEGELAALLEFGAIGPGLDANGVLELVLFDGTCWDTWTVIDDDDAVIARKPTLTLGYDFKSGTILGYSLTYGGETLDALADCVMEVNRPKFALMERHPSLAPLIEDLYGKPTLMLFDNGWRQTGGALKDACEDAGISTDFAPVKNPQYKSPVERVIRTVKGLLAKRLPGGTDHDIVLARRLGLDPRNDAILYLSELEDALAVAIFDVLHNEPPSRGGLTPLLAWRKGLRTKARKVIQDVAFLEKTMGHVHEVQLTVEGIRFKNCTFHDQETTGALLRDLAWTTPMRRRRKRLSSATASVKIKWRKGDATKVHVWNPVVGAYVTLPNWNEDFCRPGTTFGHVDELKAFADAENKAFRSPDEQQAARDRLRIVIEEASPKLKARAMRNKRKLQDRRRAIEGDTLLVRDAEPGVMAAKLPSLSLGEGDVVAEMLGPRRADGGRRRIAPPRGGGGKRKSTERPVRDREDAAAKAARLREENVRRGTGGAVSATSHAPAPARNPRPPPRPREKPGPVEQILAAAAALLDE